MAHFASTLPDQAVKLLQSAGQRRTHRKGDLVTRGLPGSGYVFIVEEGQLDLYAVQAATGKRLFITSFGPGDIFGDFAPLNASGPAADNLVLEVRSDARILNLPKDSFFRTLDGHQEALIALVNDLVAKMGLLMMRTTSLGLLSVKARLVNELMQMSRDQGLEEEDNYRLRLNASHEQLADTLGATRQSITRAFAELKKSGCIVKGKDGLMLVGKQCAACLENECYRALF